MSRLTVLIFGLLLASMLDVSSGCFHMKKIFGTSKHWIQAISMTTRYRINLDYKHKEQILFKTESDIMTKDHLQTIRMTCLESPARGRYMVKVDHGVDDRHTRYRCVRFVKLADHVIRMFQTPGSKRKDKVNCKNQVYEEEKAVLIAHEDIETTSCPLTGGYQLIMDQSVAINADCKDTVRTYNPRIQFQCDIRNLGRAVADFGRVCKPSVLTDSIALMKSRQMTHLNCAGSWTEKRGGRTNKFSTILLSLRDSPKQFWCLNYKLVPHDNPETTTYKGEEIYKLYLTLDGRCYGDNFLDGENLHNTSMFGFMASYRPENDVKCTEQFYVKSCETMKSRCYDTTDCPGICHRCKKPFVTQDCSIEESALGKWKLVNSERPELKVTVDTETLTSQTFGRLMCRAEAEDNIMSEPIYPMVQAGTSSTCMPYYACAKAHSPAQGVLNFHLRPTTRDEETGIPHTCKEMYEANKLARVPSSEQTLTLLDTSKLEKSSCEFPHLRTFKTISPCMIVVKQCIGACDTLSVYIDKTSCGNETMWPHKLEPDHQCYAKFHFLDKTFGILAASKSSNRYACWIVSPSRLFITAPELCNLDGVNRVMREMDASTHYDPLTALSEPQTGSSINEGKGNTAPTLAPHSVTVLCLIGLFLNLAKLRLVF